MAPRELHVLGIDPGGTTGWARITVSRDSVYGHEPGEVLEWDYGELTGAETIQATDVARLAREIQSLDYKIGPAVVVEDFDVSELTTTDASVLYSPIRIAAMITLLYAQSKMGDARLIMQPRSIAKQTWTDDRLRSFGLWVEGSDHIRDAVRHAMTAIRRAKKDADLRSRMWNGDMILPYLEYLDSRGA